MLARYGRAGAILSATSSGAVPVAEPDSTPKKTSKFFTIGEAKTSFGLCV